MAMNFPPMAAPQGSVPFSPLGGQPPLPFAPDPALAGFPAAPAAPAVPGGFPPQGPNPYAFGCASQLDKTV
jgi:hypothetical protein